MLSEYILKKNNLFYLKSKNGKILGKYKTKKEAKERLKQIEYFKHNPVVNETEITTDFIQIHDELNPSFFDKDDNLKKVIRLKLLEIANYFVKFLSLPKDIKVEDVIFTGSMCNYNYTKQSDIDLHIIIDFESLEGDTDMIRDYFDDKKNLFNDRFNLIVKEHPIELYTQDLNQELDAKGIYSLLKGDWVKKPVKPKINIDKSLIRKKAKEIIKKIEDLVKNPDIEKISALKKEIKETRQKGLNTKEGEFSTDNLVFKLLRNMGYIEKLYDLETKNVDKELSLKEGL